LGSVLLIFNFLTVGFFVLTAFEEIIKSSSVQQVKKLFIGGFRKRIKVKPQSAREKRRLLRNSRNVLPQIFQGNSRYVNVVDYDLAFFDLYESGKRATQRRFACACASNNAHFL